MMSIVLPNCEKVVFLKTVETQIQCVICVVEVVFRILGRMQMMIEDFYRFFVAIQVVMGVLMIAILVLLIALDVVLMVFLSIAWEKLFKDPETFILIIVFLDFS